jgi:hypothetical protein
VVEDAFALRASNAGSLGRLPKLSGLAVNVRFRGLSNRRKLDAFKDWINDQLDLYVLEDRQGLQNYTDRAFVRGLEKGYNQVRSAERVLRNEVAFSASRLEFVRMALARDNITDQLEFLGGRVFTSLKGLTEETANRLTFIMAEGLATGQTPEQIAVEITKSINGFTMNRAKMIAETEIVRANAEAQLDALEQLGQTRVSIVRSVSRSTGLCLRLARLAD